jgi:hypothetical protein
MSRKSGSPEIESKHYFVDEAGDPTLFGARGKLLVGSEGCSRYFVLGLADVDDPPTLAADLAALRARLIAGPYFKEVPSMQPEQRKTALLFHANIGGRIHFCHLPARARGRHWKSRGDGSDGSESR